MKKLIVTVGATKDSFSAWAENCEGVTAHADTVAEVKKQIAESIELNKHLNDTVPEILQGKYEVVYKFDTESFFTYIKPLLTLTGMEEYTGINNKMLSRYATGKAKPRPEQRKKIKEGIHKLAHDLLAVEL